MKTIRIFLCLSFLFCSLSCERLGGKKIRVGMDPALYPMNFMGKERYIDGFMDELFLEIARSSGASFEVYNANWDSVNQLLWEKDYDAIVTLMPPRVQNLQSYEFSEKILDVGPILIVPEKSKAKSLDDLDAKRMGFIEGEDSILILARHPKVLVQSYNSITDLLNAVVSGEVDGALAEVIIASSYVADLYGKRLKMVGEPLSEDALRLAVIKGRNQMLIPFFNKYLSKIKQKSIYTSLLRKWELLP